MRDGIPNQLTQTVVVGGHIKYVRNLIPTDFYAQDQWTFKRITLQGGVRYDSLVSNYPDSSVGGLGYPFAPEEISYPARSTPGYDWKDITPRIGAAYDLFGNGKTAVRFNVGKYMEAITATNNDLDMNPLVRTVLRTTRGWTDTNRNYLPDCDLRSPAANGIRAPSDPRLPGGGGYTIEGLYNLVPERVGIVDELARSSRNFGEQTENWQGFDYSVVARLLGGLTLQGGAGTGRRLADGCAVRAKLPELRAVPPASRTAPSRRTSW